MLCLAFSVPYAKRRLAKRIGVRPTVRVPSEMSVKIGREDPITVEFVGTEVAAAEQLPRMVDGAAKKLGLQLCD